MTRAICNLLLWIDFNFSLKVKCTSSCFGLRTRLEHLNDRENDNI